MQRLVNKIIDLLNEEGGKFTVTDSQRSKIIVIEGPFSSEEQKAEFTNKTRKQVDALVFTNLNNA